MSLAPSPSRFPPLDAQKEAKIDELLHKIRAKYPDTPVQLANAMKETKDEDAPTSHNSARLYAYAFLVSRKWDVPKAFEMAEQVIEFRQKCNADTRQLFPAPFSIRGFSQEALSAHFGRGDRVKDIVDTIGAGLDRYMQCGVHYWDHHGIPVFYVMVGRVNEVGLLTRLKKLAKVGQTPAEAMWPYLEHYMLVMEALARYQQAQLESGALNEWVQHRDGVIRSITIVMDATHLNYKMLWRPAIELLTRSLKKMFTVFPDSVFKIMVVNSPSVVRVAYSLVKPVLDENLQSKVHIYGPKETPAALQKIIDKKFIPHFLGGECRCEGHCIQSFDPDSPNAAGAGEDDGDGDGDEGDTQDIKVSAGSKEWQSIAVNPGDVVAWEYAGSEIEFYAFFVPVTDKTWEGTKWKHLSPSKHKHYLVREPVIGKRGEGDLTVPNGPPGTLVFGLDNSRAWVSAVRVQWRMVRVRGDSGSGTDPTSASAASGPESP